MGAQFLSREPDHVLHQSVEEAITDRFPHLAESDELPELVRIAISTTLRHSGLQEYMATLERRAAVAEGRLELLRVALA